MSLPKALQNLFNKKIRTVGVVDVEAGDYVHGGGIVESVEGRSSVDRWSQARVQVQRWQYQAV
jgi:hypothetical protein